MNDLLREAIADAKAVREVALANAKLALEDAFTPRLQSMLSKKLAEEAELDEEGYMEGDDETESSEEMPKYEEPSVEEGDSYWETKKPVDEADDEIDLDEFVGEAETDEEGEEKHHKSAVEEAEEDEEEYEMDEDLMGIIRQLEEDIDSSEIGKGDNKKPSSVASDDSTEDKKEKLVQLVNEEEDEESEDIKEILRSIREEEGEEEKEKVEESEEDEETVDIKEILRALREEEDDEEKEKVEEAEESEEEKKVAEYKLREAYAVIKFLRSKINEVNLLNSKLLFSNKLFKKHSLTENQKITVIENFDRASSLREVKLVFATLSEALRSSKTNIKPLKESFASKPTASTRPSKSIINEGNDMADRLRKLAGLK